MVFKAMTNKKATASLGGVIFSIILIIGLFTAMFLYMNNSLQENNIAIDEKYNDTYTKLQESQDDLSDLKADLKEKADKITEADDSWSVAWNGLLGLGTALKAPFTLLVAGEKTVEALEANIDIVPGWIKGLITLGVIFAVLLILLAVWKGESVVI
jgi:hypothetical protein